MKIIGKRIILRELGLKDAKDLAKNANEKHIFNLTSSIPYPYKLKDAKWFINKTKKDAKQKPRKNYELAIELKSEKKIIGVMGLTNINNTAKMAEIGYWIGKDYRRKGLITEAEKLILDFGFGKLKFNKIHGSAMKPNKVSNKLFKKFGFRKVGIMEEHVFKGNKKIDLVKWELLRRKYKK